MIRAVTALFLSAAALLAGGILYSKKIYGHQDFSYGLPEDSRIFFLSRWHRFRRPRGIARFPDGGQVRTVHDEVSLFRYDRDSGILVKLGVITNRPEPGTNIKNAELLVDQGTLYISFKCNNDIKHPETMHCLLSFDPETNELTRLADSAETSRANERFKDYWPRHRDRLIPISTLKRDYLSRLDAAAWDLPGYGDSPQ